MNTKKTLTILAFALAIILLAQQATALGITPGRTTMEFEPGQSKEVQFSLINSENKDTSIVLKTRGELNESIELSQNRVDLSSNERQKQLSYTVNLPEDIENPGTHKAEIVALEVPKDAKEGKFVGATVSVATQLHVNVPYPGKYLETGEIKIESGMNSADFYIPIINKGQGNIQKAQATIDIYNPQDELIETIQTDSKPIKKGVRKELIANWEGIEETGDYRAEIEVNFEGKSVQEAKNFQIGGNPVTVQRVSVDDFELGDVAKFNSRVKSNHNERITEALVRMEVYSENQETMADIESRTYEIPAQSTKNMVAYWDTEGVNEGSYQGLIALELSSLANFQQEVVFDVRSNDILVQGIGGEVIAEQAEDGNIVTILIIAVIVLAALNVLWFLIIRKYINKKKKGIKSLFSKKK